MSKRDERVELLQGTLDPIVPRAHSMRGPLDAYGLATRPDQVSDDSFAPNRGTRCPALVRLES